MPDYTIRLPRLPVNWQEQPQLFERYWDEAMTSLEETLNAILEIPGIEAAIAAAAAAAAAANTAAAAANTAAATAQSTADAIERESNLVNSYVTGLTLSAADAGADTTITVSAHTRVYGDGTSVAVNGGSITGVPYSTAAHVYYDQVSRAGGAVTYAYSTSAATAAQTGDRHSVGAVTTPAAAAPPSNGNPVRPPGYVEP